MVLREKLIKVVCFLIPWIFISLGILTFFSVVYSNMSEVEPTQIMVNNQSQNFTTFGDLLFSGEKMGDFVGIFSGLWLVTIGSLMLTRHFKDFSGGMILVLFFGTMIGPLLLWWLSG